VVRKADRPDDRTRGMRSCHTCTLGFRTHRLRESRRSPDRRAIFVGALRITSAEHGDLRVHTRRGLRIGDDENRLRELYPRSTGETHAGHTHYRLRTGDFGVYLMAKVVDGEVVQLEAWPYEFC
jgi:hypothetical protein